VGKRIAGRRRCILAGTLGLILAFVVHASNIQDCDGGEYVLAKLVGRFHRLKINWADSGYAGEFVRVARKRFRRTVEIVNRTLAGAFMVVPKHAGSLSAP